MLLLALCHRLGWQVLHPPAGDSSVLLNFICSRVVQQAGCGN